MILTPLGDHQQSSFVQVGGTVTLNDCVFESLPICIYVTSIKSIYISATNFLNTFNNTAFTVLGIEDEAVIKKSCFSNCSITNSFQSIDGCTLRLEDTDHTSSISITDTSFFYCFAPYITGTERYVMFLDSLEGNIQQTNSTFNKMAVGPGFNIKSLKSTVSYCSFIGSVCMRSVIYYGHVTGEIATAEHIIIAHNHVSSTSTSDGSVIYISTVPSVIFSDSYFVENVSPCVVAAISESNGAVFQTCYFSLAKNSILTSGKITFESSCIFNENRVSMWAGDFNHFFHVGCFNEAKFTEGNRININKIISLAVLNFVLYFFKNNLPHSDCRDSHIKAPQN